MDTKKIKYYLLLWEQDVGGSNPFTPTTPAVSNSRTAVFFCFGLFCSRLRRVSFLSMLLSREPRHAVRVRGFFLCRILGLALKMHLFYQRFPGAAFSFCPSPGFRANIYFVTATQTCGEQSAYRSFSYFWFYVRA